MGALPKKSSMILLLILPLFLLVSTSSAVKTYVEIPERTEINGTTYVISAFTPRHFIQSANFTLDASQCVQYSFKMLERRVRLHSFTCLLGEGGYCSLDKFNYPDDQEGCTYLRPWSHTVAEWNFFWIFEKRERKYGKFYEKRIREGKIKRQIRSTKRETSTKPFGHFMLYGVVDCDKACGNQGEKQLGSYSDGTFHRGKAHRLN